MTLSRFRLAISAILALFLLLPQSHARAATTILPPPETCFQATTPTSGGNYGPISVLGIPTGGSSYTTGTYSNVSLTGGSGSGAQATVVISGGAVTTVTISNAGSHYATGDALSASSSSIGGSGSGFSINVSAVVSTGTGMVGFLGGITAGTGGTAGNYAGVVLTGGSGSGVTANIVVSGGGVTAVTILNPGNNYSVGDTLSAAAGTIGGVSGFSVPVSSVAINSALAGGQVFTYVPGGNVPKQTYQNSSQTVLNANPVPLDANGCAIILGIGSYRFVVQDQSGNTIYDQVTTDTSATNNTFWAGTAGGTANAITVVDAGFNGTDGSIIQFVPLFSNTGATTFNPSGYFNVAPSIVKDTINGAVSLTGGEIVAGSPSNVVSLVYSASQSNFHILNLVNIAQATTPQTLCGATGYKSIPDSGTPNSKIDITANQQTAITNSGATISRTNVSYTLNFTTNGANGLDTGSVGASTWYYIWLIDNGSSGASLASLSSTAPTMPSGYTYKCRIGAVQTNGSNNLIATYQTGSWSQYNGSNNPSMVSGSGGSNCANTSPTYASVSYASTIAPPTFTEIRVAASNDDTAAGAVTVLAAPTTNFGGLDSATPPPIGLASASNQSMSAQWIPIGTTFGYCSSGSTGVLSALGWKDGVNAN